MNETTAEEKLANQRRLGRGRVSGYLIVSFDLDVDVLMPSAVGAAVGLSEVALLVDEEDVAGSTGALSSSSGESSAGESVGTMGIVVLLDVASSRTNAPEIEGRLATRDGERSGGSGGVGLDEGSGIERVFRGVVGSVGPGVFDDFLAVLVLDVDALVEYA